MTAPTVRKSRRNPVREEGDIRVSFRWSGSDSYQSLADIHEALKTSTEGTFSNFVYRNVVQITIMSLRADVFTTMRRQRLSQQVPVRHDTYTLSGLLAYLTVIPVVAVLLLAPGLVVAFGLGAMTAIVLRWLRSGVSIVCLSTVVTGDEPAP